ncbi:hypothetical protein P9112_009646 [Eukaryota sp. TZLM1-RC]
MFLRSFFKGSRAEDDGTCLKDVALQTVDHRNRLKTLTHNCDVSIQYSDSCQHNLTVTVTNESELELQSEDPDAVPSTFTISPATFSYPEYKPDDESEVYHIRFVGKPSFSPSSIPLFFETESKDYLPKFVSFFHSTLSMVWSMKNGQPPSHAPIEELISGTAEPRTPDQSRRPHANNASPQSSPMEFTFPSLPSSPLDGKVLYKQDVYLHEKDYKTGTTKLLYNNKVEVRIIEAAEYEHYFCIFRYNVALIAIKITTSMRLTRQDNKASFVAGTGEQATVYVIEFDSDFTQLQHLIGELALKSNYLDQEIKDLDWLVSSMVVRTPLANSYNDEDLEREAINDTEYLLDDDSEFEREAEQCYRSNASPAQNQSSSGQNIGYVPSIVSDRNFVLRKSDVEVVPLSQDGQGFSSETISIVPQWDGKPLTPKKAMLNQRDSSLLLLANESKDSIYRFDLERGEVVERFHTNNTVPVGSLSPMQKSSQLTDEKLFAGLNSNRTMVWDPRAGHGALDGKGFHYAPSTKPQLSCFSVTGDGALAVGSRKGDIRLFSSLDNKRAKTLINGWGKEILAIDTTSDGYYVLVTCEDFLMLIDTRLDDNVTGYNKRMGENKPLPIKIQLDPEDVATMGGTVAFKPARFDRNPAGEKVIVTATHRWIVTFNLSALLFVYNGGKLPAGRKTYSIAAVGQDVVEDSFVGESSTQIGVVGQSSVKLVHRSKK